MLQLPSVEAAALITACCAKEQHNDPQRSFAIQGPCWELCISRRGNELWDCSHMEAVMKIRHVFVGATIAIGLAWAAASAEAAPAVATAGDLASAARESSSVDQVYWSRRCWRYGGHLRCRRHWVDYGYGPYYYDEPYYYRPAFGFFFGGPRHHHHFRRW